MTIVVAEPQAGWRARGELLAGQVAAVLGPLAVRVEHIGSTSIPGMPAKPVIDLQVSVRDLDEAAAVLDAEGWLRRSRHERDHVPAGRDDDPGLWVKRMWTGEQLNLHMRLAGSPGERLALLFRDWFRAHPAAVPAYGAFKTVLAAELVDVGAYSDVKDPVVDLVVVVAEEWAARVGWTLQT